MIKKYLSILILSCLANAAIANGTHTKDEAAIKASACKIADKTAIDILEMEKTVPHLNPIKGKNLHQQNWSFLHEIRKRFSDFHQEQRLSNKFQAAAFLCLKQLNIDHQIKDE